ncbi:MAG: class I SAM-dependent methyltransferase [Owenweeksia sp.]
MKTYFSKGDLGDVMIRVYQRGWQELVWRFGLDARARTRNTFNHEFNISIWNMIPEVRERLNQMASGHTEVPYEQYVIDKYLKGKSGLKLLSIGCGSASHELYFAEHGPFELVHGVDLAPTLIEQARKKAEEKGLTNCLFETRDFSELKVPESYDVVLFHQSLHHFKDFEAIYKVFVLPVLKPDGYLVLNEFVGPTRLQWTRAQLKASRAVLKQMPEKYRQILNTPFVKRNVSRPGVFRMLLSDPSESVNSEKLLPVTHEHFKVVEEKPLGGNILHLLLKDIAHNFCTDDPEAKAWLSKCFEAEDAFLQENKDDFVFGVYSKP